MIQTEIEKLANKAESDQDFETIKGEWEQNVLIS